VDMAKLDRASVQVVYSTPPAFGNTVFTEDAIDILNDTIVVSTGYATGMPILLQNSGATAPSPLSKGTTYYAIKITDTMIQLATTYAQAIILEKIDLLSAVAGTRTLVPQALSLSADAGFRWYGSNDGETWTGVAASGFTVATSTQTLSAMGAGTRLLDWGEYAYRWLRFEFRGPAAGVIKLRAYLNGKKRE